MVLRRNNQPNKRKHQLRKMLTLLEANEMSSLLHKEVNILNLIRIKTYFNIDIESSDDDSSSSSDSSDSSDSFESSDSLSLEK